MSKKSKWLLAGACAALIVSLTQVVPEISVGDGVGDFAAGFGAALMFGVLVTWKDRQAC